jgi:hypothetical protein
VRTPWARAGQPVKFVLELVTYTAPLDGQQFGQPI